MFGGNMGFSLADIAAACRGNGNGDGFGGNNGWWILVILWALWGNGNVFGENNRNNNGCNGNGGGSVTYQVGADVQRGFDTQAIIQKLDGINNGLCSLGYDQLVQMNNITATVQQTGFNLQQAIAQLAASGMLQNNQLQALIQSCCCGLEKQIGDVRYDAAMQNKDLITAINQIGQNIMLNSNNNYRQLHDELFQMRYQDLKELNAQKDTQIQMLNLQASQEGQTTKIIAGVLDQLRNCPVGTYNVCNPQAGVSPVQQILNALSNSSNCCSNNNGVF